MNSTSEPVLNTDQAELARLQQFAGTQGLGEVLYDDTSELREFLGEFGLKDD